MGALWTIEALKEHFDQRFTAISDAVAVSAKTLDQRLHDMNEWRRQLDDERRQYVTVDKHDELATRIDDVRSRYVTAERFEGVTERNSVRIDGVERWQSKMVGALALVAIVLPVVTGAIVYFLTHPHH